VSAAPHTVGELAAARAILAGLPRDLPAVVVAAIVEADADLERAQGLLTGDDTPRLLCRDESLGFVAQSPAVLVPHLRE
jgi:hypothetical protein